MLFTLRMQSFTFSNVNVNVAHLQRHRAHQIIMENHHQGDLHLELKNKKINKNIKKNLELALHHRSLADGRNVDWVLPGAGRVIPDFYFFTLFIYIYSNKTNKSGFSLGRAL